MQDQQLKIDRLLYEHGEVIYWCYCVSEERIWVRFASMIGATRHTAWTSSRHRIVVSDMIVRVDQDRNQEQQYRILSIIQNPQSETQSLVLERL